SYVAKGGSDRGWWSFFEVYIVSLLKAWFGDAATEENDYGFGRLPRISGNHSHFATMMRALDGGLDGLFVMGQNPAVGSQNAGLQRQALANLKWLVVRDLAELETARFWMDAPDEIDTEVFLMPAAAHVEKDGAFTNTQRLLQWHFKALEPEGDRRSELWFMYHLGRRIRDRLASSDDPRDRPLLELAWEYATSGPYEDPSADQVLREINGVGPDGKAVGTYANLHNDGSTAAGCWTGRSRPTTNRTNHRSATRSTPSGRIRPGSSSLAGRTPTTRRKATPIPTSSGPTV